MHRIRLHVNIDHVATLRQARGVTYPDPIWAASLAELAGADGITVHLREDRRHIQDRDVRLLRESVRTVLNLEMAAIPEMVSIAKDIKPDMCTLVPEKREERTTEGGLDILSDHRKVVAETIEDLKSSGMVVSLFVDPDREVIKAAKELGADTVELHTGYYCEAEPSRRDVELDRLASASMAAVNLGLNVAAGHGLDYPNVSPVAAIPGIEELNIGHSIVARAVFVGMDRAVRDMIAQIAEAVLRS